MNDLTVIPIGARVSVGESESIDARVIAISIIPGCVRYQVAYWSGATRCELWLEEFEVKPTKDDRMHIGFQMNGFAKRH